MIYIHIFFTIYNHILKNKVTNFNNINFQHIALIQSTIQRDFTFYKNSVHLEVIKSILIKDLKNHPKRNIQIVSSTFKMLHLTRVKI